MRLSRVLRRIWRPLALIGTIYATCVTGFIITQGVTVFNGLYWGVITMSTVGYGDIVPTTTGAKLFAMALAASTIGILGFVISEVNTLALVAREEEMMGLDGTRFTDHVILLGWTPVARAALQELLLAGRKVALMTRQQEKLAEIRTFISHTVREAQADPALRRVISKEKDTFVAFGDYSQRSSLALLNLEGAREAIVASDDDARNVLSALILKDLAPHLRIVVAVLREELRETLQAAGVTYVISPSDMGGRMVTAAAIQPEVARALDELSTASEGCNVDEFAVRPGNPLLGMPFDEAHEKLRKATGAQLLGVARPMKKEGGQTIFHLEMNPPVGTSLDEGGYVIVLSSTRNLQGLRSWIGVPPGRPPLRVRGAPPRTK